MAAMVTGVGHGPGLIAIVAAVMGFLAIAVIVVVMGVAGIIMAIEKNRTGVARITAVIGDIPTVGRRGKGL
uniref:Uncharacterized protein n=1 Tax=Romanomermis culicivorax TaxID=13658 RepID=A0A915I9B1_ROMCU